MNWKLGIAKLCVVMLPMSVTFLLAQGPKGTEPHPAAASYSTHAETNGFTVGASVLTADQARHIFVSDVNRCCLVVEVAFYPPKDVPLNISLNDFALKIKGSDVAVKPSSAQIIASSLQKKARSDRDVTVTPSRSVTHQSSRGYDPATDTQGSGTTQTSRVIVGVGQPYPNPASTDKDRTDMEAELSEKGLPEGIVSAPVAGYIYFPISSKKKDANRQLECKLGENTVVLSLP